MADTRKPRAAAAESAGKPAADQPSKAAVEFERYKAARAAAEAGAADNKPPQPNAATPGFPPPTAAPAWPLPPSFSLSPMPPGWSGPLTQPGIVQPAPLAVGPLGERLGSTLRLGIDVINMALAGSLRLLGGINYGAGDHPYPAHACGCVHSHHEHSCANRYSGCDCCQVFESEHCCTPSVGSCCD